jgi:hypothetical protein
MIEHWGRAEGISASSLKQPWVLVQRVAPVAGRWWTGVAARGWGIGEGKT